MDIKKKFRSLIGKQESLSSPVEEHVSFEQLSSEPAVATFKPQPTTVDPRADQEVIEQIEKVYFSDVLVDTSLYELEKLPEELQLDKINDDRYRMRRQLEGVSRKVSELILQNQSAYATELQRVMELQRTLQLAGRICANGRRQLSVARNSFTEASLGLLANYKKKKKLLGLLKSLHTIKTLQRTDLRLREMMEEEDYCGAIQLCLECQKAASTFKHFRCISELSSKLQDTLEMIEEQLDVALSKTCTNFDVNHYEKVQTAYRLLGKTQTAMDQLHMHFTSAIHNTAFTIVLGYAELCAGTGSSNFQKKQYPDLCKHITAETFTGCLIDLCKALWEVMMNYYKTMYWHDTHEHDSSPSSDNSSNVEATFNKRYVRQKLEYGLGRIWQDVQQKVKVYVLGTNLSDYKLEEFIRVLDIIHRMIEIGEEFCGSKSEGLQDSLKQQSSKYFKFHHRSKMDELRMFLENEVWELCPVKSNFNILQLMDFKFMRHWSSTSETTHQDSKTENNIDSTFQKPNFFEEYLSSGNPFDITVDEEEVEDVFGNAESDGEKSDSDSDIPDELKHDYIDEITGETKNYRQIRRMHSRRRSGSRQFTIVTNTTLNVLRVIGKYMQMISVLKPIAFEVITCISQLFDYYLYTVYVFFTSDMAMANDISVNNRLRITLQRIHENLINENLIFGAPSSDEEDRGDRIPQPHLSPMVDLNDRDKLYGLAERIVAAESLVFLAEQLEFLQPHLENLIPPNKKAFLQQFYSQTVKMAAELRKPIYKIVTLNSIDYDSVLQYMTPVKWDVKEIMSQHNHYVDILLSGFQDFNKKLSDVSRRVPIPKVAEDVLWEHCIRQANRIIVEGYSSAKKCSNEGRALMQLDFQQFMSSLEKIIDIRPIPDKEFVEVYIKAYYMPENQLESWVQEHREYSSKQLISLINTVDHLNKKARNRLQGLIEDSDRNRR